MSNINNILIASTLIDATSSITETSDVFIKNIVQDGGSLIPGGGITTPLAIGCCLTVCIMSCTLICIIHTQSMC